MSSYYGVILPEYWDGPTGREIQKLGGAAATLLGAFLMANRRANMIGLYRLPLIDVRLPLSRGKVRQAFDVLHQVQYASYDEATEFVWVREMARIRVGLRNRSAILDRDDNKVIAINRLYREVDDNPFLAAFYDRYSKTLHLKNRRTCEHHPHMSPLERGLEGAPKPVNRSEIRSGSETDQGRSRARAREDTRTNTNGTAMRVDVLTALAGSIHLEHPEFDEYNLREELKERAGHAHMAYDGESITKAVTAVMATRSA